MTDSFSLFRTLLIYCITAPLAVLLGYLMATPYDMTTFTVLGILFFLMTFPLFIKWHHAWLVASWNMSAVLFFLPGRPNLWLFMAWFSLGISIVQHILNPKMKFLRVPSVSRPLIFLGLVVLVTARFTGGIGLNSLGSDVYGGKRYVLIISAIVGYFALTTHRIPPSKAGLYVGFFLLGGITNAIGELVSVVSPAFRFIFLIFPVSSLLSITHDPTSVTTSAGFDRFILLSIATFSLVYWMLAKYGVRGIFAAGRPKRAMFFGVFVFIGLLGGFRSFLMLLALVFIILFWLEGLARSRLLPGFMILGILAAAIMLPFVQKLPLSVQRTLTFLPVKVDPMAKISAEASSEWRIKMWQDVLPEVPKHLLLGKGYAISATDMNLARTTENFHGSENQEGAELSGDYHNGPLSVILPLGIPGVVGFLWLIAASLRVLYRNCKYGAPELRQYNAFILAYYLAKSLMFFVIFGSLYSGLFEFTGLLGLSISLNGGVARKPAVAPQQPRVVFNRFKILPGERRPANA